jgi:hypothetical protein
LDTARIALNILERSYADLLRPLNYDQAAPSGFLIVVKLLTDLFGGSEYVLRLIPLLSGIGILFIAFFIARKELRGVGSILFMGFTSFNFALIRYSSDLKPYSLDVLIAFLLVSIVVLRRFDLEKRSNRISFALLGAFSLWLSYPSVFILAGIAATQIILAYKDGEIRRVIKLVPIYGFWGILFVIHYLLVFESAQSTYLLDYWDDSFMPFPRPNLVLFRWLMDTLVQAVEYVLRMPLVSGMHIVFLLGLVIVLANNFSIGLVFLFTIGFTLIASMFHLYPVRSRLILFLFPVLAFSATAAISFVLNSLPKYRVAVSTIVASLILIPLIANTTRNFIQPPNYEDMKSILSQVSEDYLQDDRIYLYYDSEFAFRYYQPIFGLGDAPLTVGIQSRDDPIRYQEDMQRVFQYPRVWFIFSHGYTGEEGDEEDYYLNYLSENGTMLKEFHAPGAAAYLFEFP